ncbi:hypothetical protein KIN20_021537, partial [Parelaphostrongylus tenuis]
YETIFSNGVVDTSGGDVESIPGYNCKDSDRKAGYVNISLGIASIIYGVVTEKKINKHCSFYEQLPNVGHVQFVDIDGPLTPEHIVALGIPIKIYE